jgi:hypothetical protein
METRFAFKQYWKHIVCIIVLVGILLFTVNSNTEAEEVLLKNAAIPVEDNLSDLVVNFDNKSVEDDKVEFSGPLEVVTVEPDQFEMTLTSYADEIKFFAKAFGIKHDVILEDLKARHEANKELDFKETNIGYLLNDKGQVKTFDSIERGIVEYFYNFAEKNPKKVNSKRVPCTDKPAYIKNLVIYYTQKIYKNVDTATALSIAQIESGYRAKGMLKANNINGSMSKGKLVKYKNIEYGVLSYIRLLSRGYYGKGLNTVKKIGKKYNPTFDNNGNKIANPKWVKSVSSYLNKMKKLNYNVTIQDLLSKK